MVVLNKIKTCKILITGGAGYIGSHVVKLLGERGYRNILVYDNLSTGNREAVLYGKFLKADLGDETVLEDVLKHFKPEIVMHFAGRIIAPESVSKPILYYKNNLTYTINLLDLMCKYKINKFIFSSSAAVYGTPQKVPISEDAPLSPINPYGETKAMVERILKDLSQSKEDFKYVSLRYFNVAGADIDCQIGECHKPETHLIPLVLRSIVNPEFKFRIYGTDYPTPDGTCIRDFIHVMDLAEAHILALEYLLDGGDSMVLNCGYGQGYSVLEILNAIKKITAKDFVVIEADRRPADPPVLVADSSRLKKLFNWIPKYDELEIIIKTAWMWEIKNSFNH